jgi:hypothetical protein
MKPFQQVDREFTLMPNYAFDFVMVNVSSSAWKAFCVIWRQTRGWNKDNDDISLSQLKQKADFKTEHTAIRATKELESKGYIIVVREQGKANNYAINEHYEIPMSVQDLVDWNNSPPVDNPPETVDNPPETVDNSVSENKSVKHTPVKNEDDHCKNYSGGTAKIAEVPLQKLQTQKKDLKTHIKNNSKEKELVPVPEREPTEHQQIFEALSVLTGMDYKIKINQGRLNRASKQLRDAGYTIEDLQRFRDKWVQGFQWKKHRQRPSLPTVLAKIGEYEAEPLTVSGRVGVGEFDDFIQH